MTKRLRANNILKKRKKIKLFKSSNNTRFSLYTTPIGDILDEDAFTEEDLQSIMLLDDQTDFNIDLLDSDISLEEEGNIYSLLDEGVLSCQPTGADLGIYDYEPIVEEDELNGFNIDYSQLLKNSIEQDFDEMAFKNSTYSDEMQDFDKMLEEDSFKYCMLAQENSLGGQQTQVIETFKGYLEVGTPYGFVRKYHTDKVGACLVYLPQYYIRKYQLRNGDEITCIYKEIDGKRIVTSLLSINEVPYFKWNVERKWFKELKALKPAIELNGKGDYTEAISRKFKLFKGDNVFMYINKNTQKSHITTAFIKELSNMFDKVIYINPQYNPSIAITTEYNIVKFCTLFNDNINSQRTNSLLGINYAKRMLELGKSVAVVIDDINTIAMLDNNFSGEMPFSKTILNSAKYTNVGNLTMFTLVPLRTDAVNSFTVHDLFRSLETLGIVIDNNEIDLYNSYRM